MAAYANNPLDCSKKSLAEAVSDVSGTNRIISFTGVCAGPIVIAADGLTLQGVGTAIIDGGGQDAVTTVGAGRVFLVDFEVTNGANGVVARNGAHVSLSGVNSHGNSASGLVLQTASSAVLSGVSLSNNSRMGVAAVQLTFGTRADLRTLTFATYICDPTVLVRGSSGIVCPH